MTRKVRRRKKHHPPSVCGRTKGKERTEKSGDHVNELTCTANAQTGKSAPGLTDTKGPNSRVKGRTGDTEGTSFQKTSARNLSQQQGEETDWTAGEELGATVKK